MDFHILKKNTAGFLKKYGYVLIVPIVGIALMCIPQQPRPDTEESVPVTDTVQEASVEDQLEEILSHVAGAGKVRVMLTVEEGEQIRYQTNRDTTQGGDNRTVRVDTVIVTDRDRAQSGLIAQINPPVYLGAVVVCEGADSASVRLAITEAVSDATGLTSDRISVLKMK